MNLIPKVFIWVSTLFNLGIECCENQTILCGSSRTRPEVCYDALCRCDGIGHAPPTYHYSITCDDVLSEIPLGQFQEEVHRITIINNNISTLRNETFSGPSNLVFLILEKNRIETIETSAFKGLNRVYHIDLSRNLITAIREHTFNGIPGLYVLKLSDNIITDIEPNAFNSPDLKMLHLERNRIKTIGSSAFANIPQLINLILDDNEIEVIESRAFMSFSVESLYLRNNKVRVMESEAIVNVNVNLINMSGALLQNIKRDAFFFNTANYIYFGLANETSFEENFVRSNIKKIWFTQNKNSFICNCTMMWIALWLQDGTNKEKIDHESSCKTPKKMFLKDLTLNDFSHCRGMAESYDCSVGQVVVINCSLSYFRNYFAYWTHSRNGRHIRNLYVLTNILSIPFCSLEDIGDYTCVLKTYYYSTVQFVNTTTTLQVKERPVVTNRTSFKQEQDLVLSVTISSSEPVDIQWFLDNIQLVNGTDYMINTSIVPITLLQYNVPVLVDGLETRLTISNYRALSTRAYTCRISNSQGTVEEVLESRPIDIILPRNTLCNSSSRLDINCTLDADEAIPKYFIHTVGGKTIRQLQGTRVNNTYTLVIPFCSYLDIGDYTCVWDNDTSGREFVTKTTTLTIDGPPIIFQHTETMVDGFTILSVFFYSQPYPTQPKWFLNNVAILPSSGIQQTTSFSKIEIQMYRISAVIDGFISNLTMKSDQAVFGDFKCVVTNEYGVSEKTIIRRNEMYTMEKSRNDLLPTILGFSVSGLAIVLIILVVVCVKKRTQPTQNANDYIDPIGHTSNDDNVYNTVQMSRITEQHNYIEINE